MHTKAHSTLINITAMKTAVTKRPCHGCSFLLLILFSHGSSKDLIFELLL